MSSRRPPNSQTYLLFRSDLRAGAALRSKGTESQLRSAEDFGKSIPKVSHFRKH